MANEFARALRKRMTPEETKLWAHLREWRKTRRYHFRRQVPLGGYIVDFACLTRRLVLEIDAAQHTTPGHRARDAVRDATLSAMGFRVLRFDNGEMRENFEGVVETVLAVLHGRK
jgi:very-short-patch-repair endonuclease